MCLEVHTKLQIRVGFGDSVGIIFHISRRTHMLGPLIGTVCETVLKGQNVSFHAEKREFILKVSLLPKSGAM